MFDIDTDLHIDRDKENEERDSNLNNYQVLSIKKRKHS